MLRRFELADGVVYGPVQSRRLGLSLGVNLLPFNTKVCSFDCAYCQCGRSAKTPPGLRWPPPDTVEQGVTARLAALRGQGVDLSAITFSGNGEPTLHPKFSECVRVVIRARNRLLPGAHVDVLTNGVHLNRQDVIEGMNLVDGRYVKLDAGYRLLDRPRVRTTQETIAKNASRLKNFVAQSMFVWGSMDNTQPESLADWMKIVAEARPLRVQLYSIRRIPADPGLLPVPGHILRKIAATMTEQTGIPGEVY